MSRKGRLTPKRLVALFNRLERSCHAFDTGSTWSCWSWLIHPAQEAKILSLAPFYGKTGPFRMSGTPEACALECKRWTHRPAPRKARSAKARRLRAPRSRVRG